MALKLSPERRVTMTELRRETGQLCRWAEVNAGRVLILRHGRVVGALVPVAQLERLEKFESTSPMHERQRFEAENEGFERAIEGQERACVVFMPGKAPKGW